MTMRSDDGDRGMYIPAADQRIVMACDWEAYEIQLALRGERSRPKLAYLDGVLELMSPSKDLERIQGKIGRGLSFACSLRSIKEIHTAMREALASGRR